MQQYESIEPWYIWKATAVVRILFQNCICINAAAAFALTFPFTKTLNLEKNALFSRLSKVFPYGFILRFNAAAAISPSIIFQVFKWNSFDISNYCKMLLLASYSFFFFLWRQYLLNNYKMWKGKNSIRISTSSRASVNSKK